ncbi:MAG: metallophosphoesterase [Methanobacterium sp.]|nr:metallophosphoesterase [Methanobacterium sp.]
MEKIVKKTNKLNPEIIFITGDMVDGSVRLDTTTFNVINKLKAPIFFINGNHEIYEGLDEIFRILKKTNMKILRDELYEYNGIQIIGIEYSYKSNHMKKVISQLKINSEIPLILLYHLPHGLNSCKCKYRITTFRPYTCRANIPI